MKMSASQPIAACPVAEFERQAHLAMDIIDAAQAKLRAGPSSADAACEAEIKHAEDRKEAMEEAASHFVASSRTGLLFQMAELESAALDLHQGVEGLEVGEFGPLARKVERLIGLVKRGIEGTLPATSATAA